MGKRFRISILPVVLDGESGRQTFQGVGKSLNVFHHLNSELLFPCFTLQPIRNVDELYTEFFAFDCRAHFQNRCSFVEVLHDQ